MAVDRGGRGIPDDREIENVAKLCKALAHPTRVRVIHALAAQPHFHCDLGAVAGISPSLTTHHLHTLQEAGLVDCHPSESDARWLIYTLNRDRFATLCSFVGCVANPGLTGTQDQRIEEPQEERDVTKKPRVLFLCTHNSARSQMGEAFLDNHAGDRFEVHSAGLEPTGIHPMTYTVMAERGFDLADHTSKSLFDYFMQSHIGYLITVCSRAEALCPIMPFVGTRIFWDLEDPAAFEGTEEERLAKFREMRDLTEAKVLEFIASV